MNLELIEKFKKREIVVNVETQEEYNEFMGWLGEHTYLIWASGAEPASNSTRWEMHEGETTISVTGGFSMTYTDASHYKRKNYEVVKYKQLKLETKKKGMKTSEFIKRVEELGYVTDKDNWYVYVRNKRFTVALVSETRVNAIDTLYQDDVSNDLFNLIVEYASTPTKERGELEDTKYVWRLKGGPQMSDSYTYFNYHPLSNTWSLDDSNDHTPSQTLFTKEEFEELREALGIEIDFEKEEIE